ncbi:MAG: methyl-accepting chemotaxis protein [Clostridiales Family XIII bacterium]|jgi:methyl-accepting chemotaxis protein|nr:methyl-accepting chemotaxis protein [Clostridiales Family XIII bacterium]
MTSMIVLVLLVAGVLGVSGTITRYYEASENINRLQETACAAYAQGIDQYLTMLAADAETIALSGAITQASKSQEERQREIGRIFSARGDVASLYTVGADGIAVNDAEEEDIGEDYSNEPFFLEGMAHEGVHIDVPSYDQWNDSVTMTVTYRLDNVDGFSGLVCLDVAYDVVRDLTTSNALGETGYNFLVDTGGIVVAHPDERVVIDESPATSVVGGSEQAEAFVEDMLRMDSAKSGDLVIDGERVRLFSDTIPATGWKYVSVIKVDEFMGRFLAQLRSILVITAVLILVAVWIALVMSRRIAQPISAMRARLEQLAQGDLLSPLPKLTAPSRTEVGVLYASMETSLSSISAYVQDITLRLGRLAAGDLRGDPGPPPRDGAGRAPAIDYIGDYEPIQRSIEALRASLGGFFAKTGEAAKLIADTSVQMASASEELSGSTVEQAAAIDRIDKRFEGIKDSLLQTAGGASDTLEKTVRTKGELARSHEEMGRLMDSMREIGEASDAVLKIIKDIDDIAFLSSILSLNAAIEAARAGAHGKGFAVVAEEVRELAGKSAESAQYTESLLTNVQEAASKGRDIAQSVWDQIDGVSTLLGSVTSLIEEIEATVGKQAAAAGEIYTELGRLNMLVQTDSAMSEQTAGASVELSTRVTELEQEMSYFKTK